MVKLFIGGIMGYLHCCSGLRKSESFGMLPIKDYLECQVDYLESCPICGHCVIQITRLDYLNRISIIRLTNKKALKFIEKNKHLFIKKKNITNFRSKFYLNYNEFGKIKKCYSNLKNLKIGLF